MDNSKKNQLVKLDFKEEKSNTAQSDDYYSSCLNLKKNKNLENFSSSSSRSCSSSESDSSCSSDLDDENNKKRKKSLDNYRKSKKSKKNKAGNCTLITETISTVESKIWICPECKKLDDGSAMIGCDNCDDWYHWSCANIKVEPKDDEAWFCKECKDKKN